MLKLLSNPSVRDAHRPGSRSDDLIGLVEAVLRDERGATRTLVIALGPHLLRIVRRVLGRNHPDVEDVTQEAVFGTLEALPRYRGECSVLHFACRVAVLTAMNARRKLDASKRTSLKPLEGELEELATSDPLPDSNLSSQKTADAVRNLLGTLPERQGEALALHCILGYTVAEIASGAGVSQETIRSRLKHARRALREKMKADPMIRELVENVP